MNKKIASLLNNQINKELFSYYQYLAMSTHLDEQGLKGFSNFYKKQSLEEQEHASKIIEYMNTRGQHITLDTITKPKEKWSSIKTMFEDSLKQEKMITKSIYTILETSIKLKDHATTQFLQWFVEEQVEEEDQMTSIIQKLELIGPNKSALLMLDSKINPE